MSRCALYLLVAGLAVSPTALWGGGRARAESAAQLAATTLGTFEPMAKMPLPGSVEATVVASVLSGQRELACRQASAALGTATEPELSRLRWHVGHQCDDAQQVDAALLALSNSAHPLSRWARLDRAEVLRAKDPAAVVAWLPESESPWAGRERTSVIRALALADVGDVTAEVALRALVQAAPLESGAATVAIPLAAMLRARADETAKLEALTLYRRVASRAPLTAIGRQALTESATLLAELPADLRTLHAQPAIEDEQQRGRALFNAHQHEAAAAVFASIAERAHGDETVVCAARVAQQRALSRARDKRSELVALSDQVVAACNDSDVRAWSHYYAAQALVRSGDPTAAIARYDRIATDAPGHSLVDDALFKSAFAVADLGDAAGAQVRLRAVVDQHPQGDMRSLARFELAWRLRQAGDHAATLVELDQLLAEGANEAAEGIEGRAQYWRARTLAQLGRTDDAVAAWRSLILAAPLSYYGQQAFARLEQLRPALAKELRALMVVDADREPLRFRLRAELNDPAFLRAIELLAVGEVERARAEFVDVGAFGEGADPDLLWLVAALFDAAAAPAQASRIARDRLRSFMATAPRGRAYSLWRIGFPRAFTPLIDEAAAEHSVPAAFVRAVAREESAFDPNAMSSAGAHGLIQLMEATAQQHAKALKLPSHPAALRRPEVNVRIGASFMKYLWKRYASNPAVVPAAYNAGHGAADRWLRERAHQTLDEWIEAIPYDETRRYSRRVLQSYGVYAALDEGRMPSLLATLPTAR